ncbi:MAG: hypothetical protein FJ304_27965, partial [Planctomycetes bacterium]|nr:hypothetical protein [Planctomycetota bacterium]
WVLVAGKGAVLEIGTAAEPFAQNATISLFGTDQKEDIAGAGTKFVCAMSGGTLELHGARRDAVSWTQLDATAEPGAKQITLKDAVKWQTGDKLCVAPSGYSPLESEQVTVTAAAGKVVSFEPALKFKHWGTLQTFEGRTLDERAEVGLLTRNVLVRTGDDGANGFGGHVMVMAGGTAHVEGVEFARLGQRGLQARYPLHWHLVDRKGDGTAPGKGQYAKNNSVHHSSQRAVVVHGTNDVLVEGNVAFDISNHCYIPAEDGDEVRNVFRNNLGMLVRVPAAAHYAFPGNKPETSAQQENKASVFWMTNPNQVFEGNHAAGSVGGDGFLFDGRTAPGIKQAGLKKVVFTNNTAHSNQRKDKLLNGLVHYGAGVQNFGLSFDRVSNFRVPLKPDEVGLVEVRNFTAYKNAAGAVWLESQRELVTDSVFADHYVSAQFGAGGGRFDRVTIVRRSANGLGEEFLATNKPKAPSVALYVENGAANVVGKDMTFIGMDTTSYGAKRPFEERQRLGKWKFIDVADPQYDK